MCSSDLAPPNVKRLITRFGKIKSFSDLKHSGRPSTQNIKAVRDSVPESSGAVIRRYGQKLDVS